jgi:hypothetical protein
MISCEVRGHSLDDWCRSCKSGRHCTCENSGERGPLEVSGEPLAAGLTIGYNRSLPGGWSEQRNPFLGAPPAVPQNSSVTSGHKKPPAGEGLVGRHAPKRCGARPYPDLTVCWTCPRLIRRRSEFPCSMCRTRILSLTPARAYRCAGKGSSKQGIEQCRLGPRAARFDLLTKFVTSVSIRASLAWPSPVVTSRQIWPHRPGLRSWRPPRAHGTGTKGRVPLDRRRFRAQRAPGEPGWSSRGDRH